MVDVDDIRLKVGDRRNRPADKGRLQIRYLLWRQIRIAFFFFQSRSANIDRNLRKGKFIVLQIVDVFCVRGGNSQFIAVCLMKPKRQIFDIRAGSTTMEGKIIEE